jgi:Flp pilus assembly secretin CpaC
MIATTAVPEPLPTPVLRQIFVARADSCDRPPTPTGGIDWAQITEPPPARRSFSPAPPAPTALAVAGRRRPTAARVEVSRLAMLLPPSDSLHGRSLTASAGLPQKPQVQQPEPRPQEQVQPEKPLAPPEPALLRVAVRESRLLRTPENVVLVLSEQNRICDVVKQSDREITLIGKQQGTARIEVWYDPQGTKRASYLVAVASAKRDDAQLEEDRRRVERLLKYLYPDSRVKLVRERDSLIARGSAVDQQQAAKIMATVRRSQLLPVVDEIAVRSMGK